MVCLVMWNLFPNIELGQILYLTHHKFENVELDYFHRILITM